MDEQVIVTLTTWSARIGNIPTVLQTIFAQTFLPDKVVLNIAFDEIIPNNVQEYLDSHSVEVFKTEDIKVYKKLIPTLKRYPDACVISIDDDWLYPSTMIEDFLNIHNKFPNNPISGNRVCYKGMACHCGCASLTKADFFGECLNVFTPSLIENCPSDDIAYTYFELLTGHAYVWTENEYFLNMEPYNEVSPYTAKLLEVGDAIGDTFNYLVRRFGEIPFDTSLHSLISNQYLAEELVTIMSYYSIEVPMEQKMEQRMISELQVRSTKAYRLGKAMLTPYRLLRGLFVKSIEGAQATFSRALSKT